MGKFKFKTAEEAIVKIKELNLITGCDTTAILTVTQFDNKVTINLFDVEGNIKGYLAKTLNFILKGKKVPCNFPYIINLHGKYVYDIKTDIKNYNPCTRKRKRKLKTFISNP